MATLSLHLQVRTDARVSPQLIAQSNILELSDDELEQQLEEAAERNPALVIVRREEPYAPDRDSRSQVSDESISELADWIQAPSSIRTEILIEFRRLAPQRLHRIGEAIISALDDHGYFRGDLEDMAEAAGLTIEAAEQALMILQQSDPPGIGARSLAECLRCQAEASEVPPPPGTYPFLQQCLDGGPREMKQAARTLLGLSDEAIAEILDFLRDHLRPYPARLVDSDCQQSFSAPRATADVVLEASRTGSDGGLGELSVSVPQSERLQVRIDSIYASLEEGLRRRRHLGEHDQHVRETVCAARELIALLQRRHETLALVAEAIIKHQADYFATNDPRRLRPLDQKAIARVTGLHESTVCRALKGKSILLPDGVLVPFELFFDESMPAKVVLQRLIGEESPDRPQSDEALTRLMLHHDFPLARRTVTKYRLQMGIPPAHARKRNVAARPLKVAC